MNVVERRSQPAVAETVRDFFIQIGQTPREQRQTKFLLPEFAQRFGIPVGDLKVLLDLAVDLVIRPEMDGGQAVITLFTQAQNPQVREVFSRINLLEEAKQKPRLAYLACLWLNEKIQAAIQDTGDLNDLLQNPPEELMRFGIFTAWHEVTVVDRATTIDTDITMLQRLGSQLYERCQSGQQQELIYRGFGPKEGYGT